MEQTWTESEIRELIIYAKRLQGEVDDANAKLIMMNAALEREEKKVIRLNNMIKFLTNGGVFLKSLEFSSHSENILLKLLEQASLKTTKISGDGSTTTLIFCCDLLKSSLRYLSNGFNSVFLSNGLKKIAYFFSEKVLESSTPIFENFYLLSLVKTAIGKKLPIDLTNLLLSSVQQISRDGLILVEENMFSANELEKVQGIELDKGFSSSYFINDLKNFEVSYDKPYILVTSDPIQSLNQLKEIIDFIQKNNRPLIIVAEEISKEILSTLVLNTIKKKIKVAVVKYTSIKFLKTGILEDLSLLTHTTYFPPSPKSKNAIKFFLPKELGQAEKVIIKKEKSTFFISKFSKVMAKRRINELNRELLTSETDYEKNLFKVRIARLSGNIMKLKIGFSNKYQIEEERQKIENLLITLRSSLEEGYLPGAGIFYFLLRDELKNWSYLNLIGEEIYSSQLVGKTLFKPFQALCENTDLIYPYIYTEIEKKGYPFGYNLIEKKMVNTLENGIIDSAKSVRSILWNSLLLVSTILTSG